MTITLERLHDEVQIAINSVSIRLKEIHNIGMQLVEKAQKCEADPNDVMLAMMTYISAVKEMENECQTNQT